MDSPSSSSPSSTTTSPASSPTLSAQFPSPSAPTTSSRTASTLTQFPSISDKSTTLLSVPAANPPILSPLMPPANPGSTPSPPAPAEKPPFSFLHLWQDLTDINVPGGVITVKQQKKEFEGLGTQFNIVIAISTFTASLVIAFLSLARDILLNNSNTPGLGQSRPLEIGMLLGFLTTATHLIIIIVAGRAATLSFRIKALGKKPTSLELQNFRLYFYLCEQLHLMATTLFLATVLYMTFYLFSPRLVYPLVLYGYTTIGIYLFYRTGFWRASVLVEDVKSIWRLGRDMIPHIPRWFGKSSTSFVEFVKAIFAKGSMTGEISPHNSAELGQVGNNAPTGAP
ncbi:hypothetical protein BDN72DRAFT_898047 [Pluteus cervinus]|uniref:Uncharacterized protein n=1 Tax=Pluteus cervinus TaxID=181527 RepID=A0ACD3AUC5_9AGAR|nr:hypothetical protein BDN72DRAFT_898047 [Pluteus cervinus]